MIHVVILAGGYSDEHEVSLRSGSAVQAALEAKDYTTELINPHDGIENHHRNLVAADVVFPALHGLGGEDGQSQHYLETHGIRFVGSDSRASELCFNKARYDAMLQSEKILVPATELVTLETYQQSRLRQRPYVLKPNDGGSSIDTFIVRDVEDAPEHTIWEAFDRHTEMLLQELIVGIEITVAVLDSGALPVIEIIPPAHEEFDYTNKYNGATQEICPPEHISEAVQQTAQALATRLHQLTGCRDMSRSDMIITANGDIYVLETNTIPGLTPESLLPKAAAAAGISMSDLCDRLVQAALQRPAPTAPETDVP